MTKWLPVQGICKRYDIKERSVDRWVKAKILPDPVYIRGRRYWSSEQLDQRDEARLAVTNWKPIGDAAKAVVDKVRP
jgi:hypothetical protein